MSMARENLDTLNRTDFQLNCGIHKDMTFEEFETIFHTGRTLDMIHEDMIINGSRPLFEGIETSGLKVEFYIKPMVDRVPRLRYFKLTDHIILGKEVKTSRGITIGMRKSEVIDAYGEPSKMYSDCLEYNRGEDALIFEFNGHLLRSILFMSEI